MGYAIAKGVHRITLEGFDGNAEAWVEVKGGRTGADAEFILDASAGGSNGVRALSATLERAVVNWNLKAEDGDTEPMPLTRDTFENRLPFDLLSYLANATTVYYDARVLSVSALGNLNGSLAGR